MTEIIIAALLGMFAGFALASVWGVRNLRRMRDERDAALRRGRMTAGELVAAWKEVSG